VSLIKTVTHLVVICREGEIPTVTTFSDEILAKEFFSLASEQWSDSYLAKVILGPQV
jgi:hypothetical protein